MSRTVNTAPEAPPKRCAFSSRPCLIESHNHAFLPSCSAFSAPPREIHSLGNPVRILPTDVPVEYGR